MFSEIPSLPPIVFWVGEIFIILAILFTVFRIYKGPTIADRIVALDLLASIIMAQCVLLVFSSQFVSYLDVATAIAIISFLATVAFSRYLEERAKIPT